jgi:hypothetical protein
MGDNIKWVAGKYVEKIYNELTVPEMRVSGAELRIS